MTNSIAQESKVGEIKIIITIGLALFAMFFGAGNLVFPLYIGANVGQHIFYNIIGFLVGGVGIPLVGLIAIGMFKGDYWAFFNRLGKVPAFLLILVLMIILGPFGAMPRLETLVFSTLKTHLPELLATHARFSLFFCSLVFLLAYKKYKIVDILGMILSPIKIFTMCILILAGMFPWEPEIIDTSITVSSSVINSLVQGYSTMDLLAAFFFCSMVFQAIDQYKSEGIVKDSTVLIVKSSLIAWLIISIVYIGFMLVSYNNAHLLQGIPPEMMIEAVSLVVFGKLGSLFVCIIVSFACLATVLALSEVCTDYLYRIIFLGKIPRVYCLLGVIMLTYFISDIGFQAIMSYATPILEVIYPAIIVLSVMNILHKSMGIQMVKVPVFLVGSVCLLIKLL